MAGTASEETQKTVRVLAGPHARVQFNRTCTQQTKGSGDCGCYALAYATTIVLGGSCFEVTTIWHYTNILSLLLLLLRFQNVHCRYVSAGFWKN